MSVSCHGCVVFYLVMWSGWLVVNAVKHPQKFVNTNGRSKPNWQQFDSILKQ